MKKLMILGIVSNLLLVYTTCCYSTKITNLVTSTDSKVVKIGVVTNEHLRYLGSGCVISKKGLILTCAHLVNKNVIKVFVKFNNGIVCKAHLVKVNSNYDLALVQPEPPDKKFKYLKFGKEVKRGQQVLLFGSPLGIQHTVSVGWVENILDQWNSVVIHSAPTNPGNSGGPLIDLNGRLVGIGEGVLMLNPFFPAQGLFLAVNITTIKDFVKGSL